MKVGLTASAFDLLHAGHIEMLKDAKAACDYLVCALHVDPSRERQTKNKPVQSIAERYVQLAAVKYVDEIVPYETEEELAALILLKKIDVRIIGEEYKDQDYTGKGLTGEVVYNTRRHAFSSSELRERVYRLQI